MTVWDEILSRIRPEMPEEDFRRWFGATAYASDAGDQITVWVPTEAIRRHIAQHYDDEIRRALEAIERSETTVRFVVSGTDDEDDEDTA
jgi:chromosomal replication initiation ATPase DnaA